MPKSRIKYRALKKHWKYQLGDDFILLTGIYPKKLIKTPYVQLTKKGKLTVRKSYAWDGPSGPMRDDESNMRSSLVHDALYQLMRMGELGQEWKQPADELFHDMCVNDGMRPRRARRAYKGLQAFGGAASKKQGGDKVKWKFAPPK